MRLAALRPILFRSVQYRAGDSLPADNEQMVEAWLSAKSAAWRDDDGEPEPPKKAKLATATPGAPGISADGDPDALVGRVRETPQRKVGRKGAGK